MRTTTRFIVTAITAFMMLAMLTGIASARTRIEVSPTTTRLTSRGLVFAGTVNVTCDVTLNGTLQRLITKALGSPAGSVTEGRTTNCRESFFGATRALVLAEPRNGFPITYSSITGTLPTITGGTLLVEGAFELHVSPFGAAAECLFRGRIGARAVENPIRRLAVETTRHGRIPLAPGGDLRGDGLCPASGDMRGDFVPATAITLRLLER
jgi:hypothetical protein